MTLPDISRDDQHPPNPIPVGGGLPTRGADLLVTMKARFRLGCARHHVLIAVTQPHAPYTQSW
jgi:hypothetical protein